MRSFLFKNIWMLSPRDRRARHESLHPRKNLIVGRNHTGKSSLIKTIFLTLGAKPKGKLLQWDENTLSLVEFSINGGGFLALHQRGNRALFTENGDLLFVTATHSEWSAYLTKTIGFNLSLTDKMDISVQADLRCFFLPFYINQDGSWQASWDTFDGMKQYRDPIGSILEYFTGIKPPEYYQIKAERELKQSALDDIQNEKKFLGRAQARFSQSLPASGPKLIPENFDLQIAKLVDAVTELNRKQETFRERAVHQRELVENLRLQIELAEDALGAYSSDTRFLRSKAREKLVCPTCRAEHSESFLEILTYAEDARVLRDLVVRLRGDASEMIRELEKTESERQSLRHDYLSISEILDTRRGELVFRDVVDSAGVESALSAFENEANTLQKDIEEHLGQLARMTDRMTRLTDKSRSKAILENFRNTYASTALALNLPVTSTTRLRLQSRPDLSGSGGPRSVLAYYAALWSTCYASNATFAVPLVIDAPNQQGQDHINLPKVLHFISAYLPSSAQIIVGSEIDTECEFDKKITLDKTYSLLRNDDFSAVEAVITPYEKAMYDGLRQRDSEV